MDVIWVRVTVLAGVFALSACGGGSAPQLVRTHGTLVRVGGPAPGAPVPLHGVRLHLAGSGGSADVRTDRHGRFVAALAPGTYRVTVTGGGPQAGGRPIQPVPHLVHVPHTGRLRLVVNVK